MYKDILGRVPYDLDLVIKSVPDSSGAHLIIGVFKGKSVWYKVCNNSTTLSHCKAQNFFVLTAPTKEEQAIKDTLIRMINK